MQIQIVIAAPVDRVWAHLRNLTAHAEWMSDAASIEFLTEQQEGVGTRLRVMTNVWPFRIADEMTVTDWVENSLITADHVGSVKGTGTFEVTAEGESTTIVWIENLVFPWWLGGKLGHLVAQPILRRIWTGNLERLKRQVEKGA